MSRIEFMYLGGLGSTIITDGRSREDAVESVKVFLADPNGTYVSVTPRDTVCIPRSSVLTVVVRDT